VTEDQVREATGWPVRFAENVQRIAPATDHELAVLRDLHRRTLIAHGTATTAD